MTILSVPPQAQSGQTNPKRIKIISCSDSLYWYSLSIGEVFEYHKETDTDYLIRTGDFAGWMSISKEDAVKIGGDDE